MTTIPTPPGLARARALVVGVGGLGAPAALVLARAGVGSLVLVDPDLVEVSNLHRQPLYDDRDLGRPKVAVAAERLAAAAPGMRITARCERVDAGHAGALRAVDVVLDGTDAIATKFLVNDLCVEAGVPLVHAGVLGWRLQCLTVLPGRTACYRCVFEEAPPPGDVPSCSEAGVLGPAAVLAGSLQAAEALRVLAGRPAWANRLVTTDLLAGRHRALPLAQNPRCPACIAVGAVPRSEAR
jgi:molybdopterin-synthase adenylyltransferase